jgi:putative alpha-1,2-mannosidase
VIGVPLVDKAEIDVEGGVFTIERKGYSSDNRYIQSITLNGKTLERNYLTHDEIIAGGELVFTMGADKICWY